MQILQRAKSRQGSEEERAGERGMPDENARHAKVESKRKAFCLPSRSYHSPLPITHTHTHTSQATFPESAGQNAIGCRFWRGNRTGKTEGDWFDSLPRRCVGVSAPGAQAGGSRGGVASPA